MLATARYILVSTLSMLTSSLLKNWPPTFSVRPVTVGPCVTEQSLNISTNWSMWPPCSSTRPAEARGAFLWFLWISEVADAN